MSEGTFWGIILVDIFASVIFLGPGPRTAVNDVIDIVNF